MAVSPGSPFRPRLRLCHRSSTPPRRTADHWCPVFYAVASLGLPYESVLVFALLGILSRPWQHGNLKLPAALQRVLQKVLVTPEMHRVHHSSATNDGNRNFSVIFPWWDRWFGTYAAQPVDGRSALRFGLADRQNASDVTFFRLLLAPLGEMQRLRFGRQLSRK